jgi:hypothetical protein
MVDWVNLRSIIEDLLQDALRREVCRNGNVHHFQYVSVLQLGYYILESGNWKLEGFGKGRFLVAVRYALFMWNEVWIENYIRKCSLYSFSEIHEPAEKAGINTK